jgi:hypothetical protein
MLLVESTRVASLLLLISVAMAVAVEWNSSTEITRALLLDCLNGGNLTRFSMRPWCWCPPEAPVCFGEECTLTWGEPTQLPNKYKLLELQLANATTATDNGWVLFDGYPPACDQCTCYDANKPRVPRLDHTLRRYKLLHSHISHGLRPRRVLDCKQTAK